MIEMGFIDADGCAPLRGAGGDGAPVIYVIDMPEHPFDIASAAEGVRTAVVRVPVRDWNDSLTPWPAAGVRPGAADFGGKAAETLAELTGAVIPAVEAAHGFSPAHRWAFRALCVCERGFDVLSVRLPFGLGLVRGLGRIPAPALSGRREALRVSLDWEEGAPRRASHHAVRSG